MVHFLEQLVDSIYRPSYWYQLIRHWAANCLPAGTAERPCEGSGCGGRGPEAALMTRVWGDALLPPTPPQRKRKSKKMWRSRRKSPRRNGQNQIG